MTAIRSSFPRKQPQLLFLVSAHIFVTGLQELFRKGALWDVGYVSQFASVSNFILLFVCQEEMAYNCVTEFIGLVFYGFGGL